MSSDWCLAKADLSELRFGGAQWQAEADDDAVTVSELRKRAESAAKWLIAQPSGRRLDRLILDVDASVCLWVRTASTRGPLLAAAVRRAAEQVAQSFPATTAELACVHPAPPESSEQPVTAIWHADGPARLLLDALDRRGVRPTAVRSLWHELADAAPADTTMSAAVLIQHDRIVWAWSNDGSLVAAGSTRRAPGDTPDRAAARISMDWLSWSAHLGGSPGSLRIFAASQPEAQAVAAPLAGKWDLTPSHEISEHPLEALAARDTIPSSGTLGGLSARPTRRDRVRLRFAAAAVTLAAVGVVGLAMKLHQAKNDWRRTAAEVDRHSVTIVEAFDPEIASQRRMRTALQSRISELRSQTQNAPELPPPPRPFLPVLEGVLSTIAAQESPPELQEVRLQAQAGVDLTLLVEGLTEAIRVTEELRQSGLGLQWTRSQTTPTTTGRERAQLSGAWPQ